MTVTFADKIEVLCRIWPVSVTSWWRSESRNKAVGGVHNSKHLKGLAVDVVLDPGADPGEFVEVAVKLGLRVLEEGDHFHIQEP